MAQYQRVLLKLSGEALMGDAQQGIDTKILTEYASQVKEILAMGVRVGIVIGGGNIFRGLKGIEKGFDRVKGDYMGMLATVINGLAIQSALESLEVKARVVSAIGMEPVCERFFKPDVMERLENKEVMIFVAGTGNPYFTTDTAAALRAVEMKADVLLKGTRVDGVYDADPEKKKDAKKFDTITFDEVYERNLNVMDMTAFTMCRENNIPIVVFNMNKSGSLKRIISGERIGTLVKN
jgi:uridylate kinase